MPSHQQYDRVRVWKEAARKRHDGRYIYDSITEISSRAKITILCQIHGPFTQSASSHLYSGCGCPACGKLRTGAAARLDPDEFEALAFKAHNSRYSYTGDYVGRASKVTVVCPEHGPFRQEANAHLRGQGCASCANIARGVEKKVKWADPETRQKYVDAFSADAKGRSSRSTAMWADPDFRNAVTAKSRTMWQNDEFRKRMAELRQLHRQPVVSSLTTAVVAVLDSLGIKYEIEKPIGFWNFDVFIPSHDILIECNGEYWHSLPKAIRNDKAKATYIERYFPQLKLVTIWEVEFFKKGRVRYLLEKVLGLTKSTKPVDFGSLSVVGIDRKQASSLYAACHYLGSCRGSAHFGVVQDNVLIGACSFGPFQRNEQTLKYGRDAVELTRFCIDPDYQVKNLGSWFLSRCVKRLAKTVVTYADTTQGHDGALYKACNFKLSHIVQPDYYYVDAGGFVLHKKSVWNQARSLGQSEAAYATLHNLTKKFGGEKRCFIHQ